MAVLVIAVVTLALFALVDLVTAQSTTTTTVPGVVIGGLPTATHSTIFSGDSGDGVPPSNVASALVVPRGTRLVKVLPTGSCACAGDYSISYELSVRAPRAELLGYYVGHLGALGWDAYSKSSAPDGLGYEDLFQIEGTDGNYWELGVIAKPTVGGVTTFQFRLFEATDS